MSKKKFSEDSYEKALIALFHDELDYEYIYGPEGEALYYYAIYRGSQPSSQYPNRFTKHGWALYSPYMFGSSNVSMNSDNSGYFRDGGQAIPSEEGIRTGTYKLDGGTFPYGVFVFVYILGKVDCND